MISISIDGLQKRFGRVVAVNNLCPISRRVSHLDISSIRMQDHVLRFLPPEPWMLV